MIEKTREIKLTNRDTGSVGYFLADTNTNRKFAPGETKTITFDELERLSWSNGGKELLRDYLIIADEEAAREVLGDVEPEYFYTKETINTLLSEGSLEQLQDTLEFGPKGVIDLVKQQAVDMKLDSDIKRKEIQKATNFNVSKAIELSEGDNTKAEDDTATSKRRTAPIAASAQKSTPSRKAEALSTTSKYKIIK